MEKYVRKCLESLKGQSLKQIEVICIDDGSTDRSGEIADEYESSEFPIFRVIHTENKGLSAARNRGIDEAKADWLMFVDSDDWVDSKFCEIPWKAKEEFCADLVIFRAYWVRKGNPVIEGPKEVPVGVVDFNTAIKFDGCSAWRRLYRRELFVGIRYPEGRVFEDVATTHKIVHAAGKIVFLSEFLYYQLDREGSITYSHKAINHRDSFLANLERYEELVEWGYPEEKVRPSLCSSALGFIASGYPKEDELFQKAKDVIQSTRMFPKSYPIWKRVALFIWKHDERFFFLISKMTGRLNYKNIGNEKREKKDVISNG